MGPGMQILFAITTGERYLGDDSYREYFSWSQEANVEGLEEIDRLFLKYKIDPIERQKMKEGMETVLGANVLEEFSRIGRELNKIRRDTIRVMELSHS